MIWSYDISNCFNYTERKDFSFKLPGTLTKITRNLSVISVTLRGISTE